MKLSVTASAVLALGLLAPQDQNERLRQNLKDDIAGPWIYDDLAKGYAEAKASAKPMMVVIRCVP